MLIVAVIQQKNQTFFLIATERERKMESRAFLLVCSQILNIDWYLGTVMQLEDQGAGTVAEH